MRKMMMGFAAAAMLAGGLAPAVVSAQDYDHDSYYRNHDRYNHDRYNHDRYDRDRHDRDRYDRNRGYRGYHYGWRNNHCRWNQRGWYDQWGRWHWC